MTKFEARFEEIKQRMDTFRHWQFEHINGGFGLVSDKQTFVIKPVFDEEDSEIIDQLQNFAEASGDITYLVSMIVDLLDKQELLLSLLKDMGKLLLLMQEENSNKLSLDKSDNMWYNRLSEKTYPTVGEK